MLLPHELDLYANEILGDVHSTETEILEAIAAFLLVASERGAYSPETQLLTNVFFQDVAEIRTKRAAEIANESERIIREASAFSVKQENFTGDRTMIIAVVNRHAAEMRGKVHEAFNNLGFNRMPMENAVASALDTVEMWQTGGYPERPTAEILEDAIADISNTGIQNFQTVTAIDADIRKSLLKTIKDCTTEQSEIIADILGYDLYQITAHLGSRESHSHWQGLIVSRFPTTGYEWIGERVSQGLLETNCRHQKYGIARNTPNRYTQEELTAFNRAFEYEGREMLPWESGAKLRYIERKSRELSREIIMLETANNHEKAAALAIKQKNYYAVYRRLAKASGFSEQIERLNLRR